MTYLRQYPTKWGKTEAISLKGRGKTKVSTLTTLTQCSTEFPSQSDKARERNKKDSNGERKSQIIPICK
jgi:hypothetical protein